MLKSREENEEDSEIKYPVMLRGSITGLIVLFYEPECGVVVKSSSDRRYHIGQYSIEWNMCFFDTKVKSITITDE